MSHGNGPKPPDNTGPKPPDNTNPKPPDNTNPKPPDDTGTKPVVPAFDLAKAPQSVKIALPVAEALEVLLVKPGSFTIGSEEAETEEPPTKVEVEAGRWFLVSDDRHLHLDSRDFGQIDPVGCQHIVFRLVGAAGFGDTAKRLSIIW